MAVRDAVNQLITQFVQQDKYVNAICHGVSMLAWSRIDGGSLRQGRQVSGYSGGSPQAVIHGRTYSWNELTGQWHFETNGGQMFASRSLGDRTTAVDDVFVDGKITTAEDFNSARRFGQVLAERITG